MLLRPLWLKSFLSCNQLMRPSPHKPTFAKAAISLFASVAFLYAQPLPTHVDAAAGPPRVVVISDIGNEPDDQMSLVRFLLYSNEFEVEALIASTSTWQKAATHSETMHKLIDAYAEVRPNLLLHAKGWPTAEYLHGHVFSGQSAYGIAATGSDKMSEGARAIIRAADRDDPRPLWITIWGGANTLAQALLEIRQTHKSEDVEKFVSKLRVYSISDQDDAGPWIRREFPNLFYIVTPRRRTENSITTQPGPASVGTPTTAIVRALITLWLQTNGWIRTFAARARSVSSIPSFCSSWKATHPRFSTWSTMA
jgi:hypothetical protein